MVFRTLAGAIVTGGASGIGFATARLLARGNTSVVVCDLEEPAELIDGVDFLKGDVRDPITLEQAVSKLGGRVGALVLCAARGPLYHYSKEIVETNHHAQIENALACQKALVEWASVVTVSSTAALRVDPDNRWLPLVDEPYTGGRNLERWVEIAAMSPRDAYALSKWAVIRSTMRLGRMLANTRVRVNCVVPGPTRTRMSEALWRERPADWSDLTRESPVGLANEPDDVATVIEWLCTDSARMVFGSVLYVDGGWKVSHADY